MTNIYDDFEKRFTSSWFSSSWTEVLPQQSTNFECGPKELVELHAELYSQDAFPAKSRLEELQEELQALKADVESISFKQVRLDNLAKFYQ